MVAQNNKTTYKQHTYNFSSFEDWITSIYNSSGGIISGFYVLAFKAMKDTTFNTKLADIDNNLTPHKYNLHKGDYILLMVDPKIREHLFYTLPMGAKLQSIHTLCGFSPIKAASLGKRIYPSFIKIISEQEFNETYSILCTAEDGKKYGAFNSGMYHFNDTECVGLCALNKQPIIYNMRVRNKNNMYSILGCSFNRGISYAYHPNSSKRYYTFRCYGSADVNICLNNKTGEIFSDNLVQLDMKDTLGIFNDEWATFQSVNLSGKCIPGKKRLANEEIRIATKSKINILNPNIFTGTTPGLMVRTPYFTKEVNAAELAEDIFQIDKNYIQTSEEYSNGKGNPIIYVNSAADKKKMAPRYPTILFKDKMHKVLTTYPSKFTYALMNNCTYYGGRKDNRHLDKCFGITQEIDGMNNQQLERLLNDCRIKKLPMPNYITISKSKKGVHLYYLFDQPVDCQWWNTEQLKIMKRSLCDILWKTSYSDAEPQNFQPFVQSFMLPGFVYGSQDGECTRTFSTGTPKYSVKELSQFIGYDWLEEPDARKKYNMYKDAKHDLQYAKEHWPKWYQKVVVEGRGGKTYVAGAGFYNWFLNKIYEKDAIKPGHRYYALGALSIIAIKCGISKEQLKLDTTEILDNFNSNIYDEPFTKEDLTASIKHFYNPKYIKTTRERLSEYSGIKMNKQKRNYKSQAEHIANIQKIRNKKYSGNWRKVWGREKMVREWAKKQDGSYNRSKCAEELHISRNTAITYLQKIENELQRASLFNNTVNAEYSVPTMVDVTTDSVTEVTTKKALNITDSPPW